MGFQDLSRCWSDCLLKAFSLSSPSSLLPSSGSVAVVSVVSFRATLLSASISLSDHRRVVFILWHIHSRRPFFSAFLQLFCLKTFIGFESFILLLFWLIVFFFFFFFFYFFIYSFFYIKVRLVRFLHFQPVGFLFRVDVSGGCSISLPFSDGSSRLRGPFLHFKRFT